MSKEVYCIYTCDAWKDRSSMALQAVCTSLTKLRAIISNGIRAELFCFDDEDLSFDKQAKQFRDAYNAEQANTGTIPTATLDRVKYVYVETAVLNDNPFL